MDRHEVTGAKDEPFSIVTERPDLPGLTATEQEDFMRLTRRAMGIEAEGHPELANVAHDQGGRGSD